MAFGTLPSPGDPKWVFIAHDLLGNYFGLQHYEAINEIENRLQLMDEMCQRAGGELVSRQVISSVIADVISTYGGMNYSD